MYLKNLCYQPFWINAPFNNTSYNAGGDSFVRREVGSNTINTKGALRRVGKITEQYFFHFCLNSTFLIPARSHGVCSPPNRGTFVSAQQRQMPFLVPSLTFFGIWATALTTSKPCFLQPIQLEQTVIPLSAMCLALVYTEVSWLYCSVWLGDRSE